MQDVFLLSLSTVLPCCLIFSNMFGIFFSYDLITQWLKNINSMVPVLGNLLWFATWLSIWFIFGDVPYTFEDNMYSAIVGCSVLCVVRLSRKCFSMLYFYWFFCLFLSVTERFVNISNYESWFTHFSFSAKFWCFIYFEVVLLRAPTFVICISVEQPFCYPALFLKVCFLIH